MTYKCALCGTENVFARCDICNGNYCEACDDMNHKHPKRKNHVRRRILTDLATKTRPPLPPKGENVSSPPPIPPPRRNRKSAQVGCNLAWSFHPFPRIFFQADDVLSILGTFELQIQNLFGRLLAGCIGINGNQVAKITNLVTQRAIATLSPVTSSRLSMNVVLLIRCCFLLVVSCTTLRAAPVSLISAREHVTPRHREDC